MIIFATILIAFSCICYEFLLANIISLYFGGTIQQYTITIGTYVFALGFGSIYYSKLSNFNMKSFVNTELTLLTIGSSLPFLIILIKFIFPFWIAYGISIICIFIIGFLAGLEIPFLMDLYNKKTNTFSSTILFWDYIGTFLGCILFPLILLNFFNIIAIGLILGIISIFSLIIINRSDKKELMKLFAILLIFLILLYNQIFFLNLAKQLYLYN